MKKWISLLLSLSLLLGAFSFANAEDEKVLNIFTWDTYIDYATVIQPFSEQTGIKVNYATFSSNEEMLTKLQANGGSEYDIILASDYALNILRKTELVQKLDKDVLTNWGNINTGCLNQYFDPDNEFVVPYVFGTPLIVYDPALVDIDITSYADLWDASLADSLVLMDDARNVIGITLRTMGKSMNETDPAVLEQAKEKLFTLKPNIRALDYDTPYNLIVSGEVSVAYMFTPQVVYALQARPDLQVVYPSEGLGFGIDGLVIPVNAPHAANANQFLNFVLSGEIGARIAEVQFYGNPNAASVDFVSDEYKSNEAVLPALNIPSEYMQNNEYIIDLGENENLYQDIWTQFKQQ